MDPSSVAQSMDTLKRNAVPPPPVAFESRQQPQSLDDLVQRKKKTSTSSYEQPLDKSPVPAINELLEVLLLH